MGRLFELDDLGDHALKGFDRAQRAFRVRGAGAREGRFAALHATGVTPLVGREQELTLLLEGWRQSKAGAGQVVHIVGEPGIGKSRVVLALRELLRHEPCISLSYHCSPHHTHSAFYPVIEQLAQAAGFSREDATDARLTKLEAMLRVATPDAAEAVPVIAALLAVPSNGRYAPLGLTPQEQRARTFETLLSQLDGLSAKKQVVMILEDVHWADPTTLELLGRVVERVQHLPVLVLVTFRPEFVPPWAGHGHVTALPLGRLGRRQGGALVEGVAGGKGLPTEVLEQILARTDGVPLFAEELTKAVLESGLLVDKGDHYELEAPLPPLAIPATLQDSLMARLDRLASVKEVAQIAAVIGREFARALLAAVVSLREDELQHALDQLVRAELVFTCGQLHEASYAFKHALVRDAAYESLLRRRRQQLHAKIAEVLEERFASLAAMQPEVLARHCTEAGLTEKAIAYWHQAGQSSVARSAMTEAIAHFTTALELVRQQPENAARDRNELELQLALGAALMAAKGWASPDMGQVYARACELSRQLGDASSLFLALFGLYVFHQNRAELSDARAVTEELLRRAQQRGDAAVEFLARRVIGSNLLFCGRLDAAAAHLKQVVASYDPRKHALAAFVPLDPRAAAAGFLAWVLLCQGHPDRALAESRAALAIVRELGHPYGLAYGLHLNCVFHQLRRDRRRVGEQSEVLVAVAMEQGFPHLVGTGTFFRGWAMAESGKVREGIAEMHRGLTAKRATGAELKVPYYLGLLAAAQLAVERPIEALSFLKEAHARVEKTGERWFEAELHRLRGDALLRIASGDASSAEASFAQAIAIAQRRGAKWWELRAVTSLARLWAAGGERGRAVDLLAPVYGWFTEGFDTPDLIEVRALLDTLA